MKTLFHYDLFAGIGGFSLALDTIFYEQEIEHIFCEWEAFPTAVLKKHWPDATYYGDIADLVADTERTRRQRELRDTKGQHRLCDRSGEDQDITILTGGFPCQPFSHAGRRKGTSDDRYKWPEMFRVIQNVRPDWVIAENVRGLVTWNEGMVLETVCADLESEGYEVQPIIIPAVAIGAPHRRDRVWIIAHATSKRRNNGEYNREERQILHNQNRDAKENKPERSGRKCGLGKIGADVANPRQQLREQRSGEGVEADTTIRATSSETNQREHQYTWADDWREVAFATCHDGVDDGLPRQMDGATLRGKRTDSISSSKHRKERLKSCGNAIVPQVAMEIFRAIKITEQL